MPQSEDFSASASEFEEDYGTGSGSAVYIALVDAPVKENEDICIEDSFIGGKPVWLHPESLPSDNLLECGACKSRDNMKLLLQAFCPLDPDQVQSVQASHGVDNMEHVSADDDRVLYVFLCTKCQRKANSVRCIRGVKKNTKKSAPEKLSEKMEKLSFQKDFKINPFDLSNGEDSNPFSSNPFQSGESGANPFSSVLNAAKASEEKPSNELSLKATRKLHDAKADKKFDEAEAFKSFLLYVEEESFKNKKPDHLKLPKNLKIDKEALDLTGEDEANLDKDPIKLDPRTEKLSKFLDDDVFQKFQEIVGYNPQQVLRYDFGGKPLLYAQSKIDFEKTVANPAYNPSSRRVFEMQLMPKMIIDLESDASLTGGMEWGTILVFSDVQNYIPEFDENGVGYVEEVVKVQWESRN